MPIDIPPDKINLPPPRQTTEVDAAKASPRANVDTSATLKAVVSEVVQSTQAKAQVQAGASTLQTQKTLYDALLTINPGDRQPSGKQAPITQIDNKIAQQLVQGATVQIKVQTQAPLKVGQQLMVQLQGQALKLLEIAPPNIQNKLQHFIRHEVNQQNSYTYLLTKLMAIAQTIKAQNTVVKAVTPNDQTGKQQLANSSVPNPNAGTKPSIATKPTIPLISTNTSKGAAPQSQLLNSTNQQPAVTSSGATKPDVNKPLGNNNNDAKPNTPAKPPNNLQPLEKAVSRFIESLPSKNDVTTADGLKTAIKNSGIFYENQITKPLPGENGKSSSPKELIVQIRQQIKALKTILNEATPKTETTSKAESTPLFQRVSKDLKFNLLNLQKQLEKLEKVDKPVIESVAKDIKPENKSGSAKQDLDPGVGKNKNIGETLAAKDKVDIKPGEPRQGDGRPIPAKPTSPVYQRPTISSTLTSQTGVASADNDAESKSATAQKSVASEPLVHPPLPGKMDIQAQAIRPQMMAKESLADALISVLIKNTKEATSRLNLHQLTNLTDVARQEGTAPQTSLSFELPILNGTDLSLFQFRIKEEENEAGKNSDDLEQQRKWVVHMGFDLEGLGAMYCQITLIGVSASVTFWAEERETVAYSEAHLDELRNNLSNLGVNVKDMQCIEGSPPTDQSGVKQTLIDIET